MSATLMCALLSIAFTFNISERAFTIENTTWLWHGNEPVAAVLIATAIVFGVLWFKAERQMRATI